MSRAWIQTASGNPFYPLVPQSADVRIEDIAHALSNVCRWTGHVRDFLSVAQHSVLVSRAVPSEDALWGLLHDASEAYIADVSSPLKRTPEFVAYRYAEASVMATVCERFGLPTTQPKSVKLADRRMMYTEARDLMTGLVNHPNWEWDDNLPYAETIVPWSPREARSIFLETFETLSGR